MGEYFVLRSRETDLFVESGEGYIRLTDDIARCMSTDLSEIRELRIMMNDRNLDFNFDVVSVDITVNKIIP